jgi:hypothetical protein
MSARIIAQAEAHAMRLGRILLAGLAGGALAAAVNTALLLIGKAAGVAFLAPVNGPTAPLVALQPLNVIMLSLIPALIAALLLTGLARLTRHPQLIFQAVAGAFLLFSLIPDWALPMDSLATRILLSLMHLVAAALIVGALLRAGKSG